MTTQIKVELQDALGTDTSIACAAWTSSLDYQKKQTRTPEDVQRVIELLADKKHSVPFESVVFRFWMKIPIATDRQIMTHRIASHSGMSGRYRTMPSEYLAIQDDLLPILEKIDNHYKKDYGSLYSRIYRDVCSKANQEYNYIIGAIKSDRKLGIISEDEYKRLREFYRGMLPQHNMTERVTVINLRSWCNFYRLRSKPDAQPEIRIVANLMREQIEQANIIPIALACLAKNDWVI